MKTHTTLNLAEINQKFRSSTPEEIVRWALSIAERPVVSTNFRPYEAAILYVVSRQKSDIPVIWCDTGYNTPQTYRHAERTIAQLQLNVDLYVPQRTAAHRDAVLGIPEIDTPEHDAFTHEVKLEPFERAMRHHQPDFWFTNLRKNQTNFRSTLDVLSLSKDGVLKVSPFYHWDDEDLDAYLRQHALESETRYFDPTKALANRECGLHT
jgi:phosphoadenosine phosphosulfate reductase